MEYLKIIILAIAMVALSFAGLAITILIRKGGKFPDFHISSNKQLRKRGIQCVQAQDRMEQKKAEGKEVYRNLKMQNNK